MIEANLNQLDRDHLVSALFESFRTAVKLNNSGKAMVFAMAIASEDREVPSIQAYLPWHHHKMVWINVDRLQRKSYLAREKSSLQGLFEFPFS
ncbi:MAG: hypothetical protein ACK59A_14255 [Cyanobacteriota bacterium]